MASKSSSDNGTRAACAMASRCSTALVEPPTAITTAIAFSKALRVRMPLGTICLCTAASRTSADWAALSDFSKSSAAIVDEYGRLMPNASIAEDIVLAVYIPPHDPAPGQDLTVVSAFEAVGSKVLPVVSARFDR